MTTLREQIQDALQVALKGGVPEVEDRVFVEPDRRMAATDVPCLTCEVGHMTASYEAGDSAGPGRRLVSVEYAVTVDTVCEGEWASYRPQAKRIASAVRRTIAAFDRTMPSPRAVDWRLAGEQPVTIPTEAGAAGGFVQSYVATLLVTEDEPDEAVPSPMTF